MVVVGSLWPHVWQMQGLYYMVRELTFSIFRQLLLDKDGHQYPPPSSPQLSNLGRMSTSPSQYLLIQFPETLWQASLGLVSTDKQIVVAKVARKLWLASLGHIPSLGEVQNITMDSPLVIPGIERSSSKESEGGMIKHTGQTTQHCIALQGNVGLR